MSIWTALRTGSSGLQAHGRAISTVGDNIANVSTVGFKAARSNFQDVLGGTAPNGQRLGSGVRLGGVDADFGQGSLQQTGGKLDLAIHGNGFFMVKGSHGGMDGVYFTRDGQFHLDAGGHIVNASGLRVQGYTVDSTGHVSTTVGDLRIGGQSPPQSTTQLAMKVNLDSSSTTPVDAWDPVDPEGTTNFATSVTVFDSLGGHHRVNMYFRHNGGGIWEWHAMVDGGEVDGGVEGELTEFASGELTFDPNGALDSQTTLASQVDFINAAPGQEITFDFGDAIADGGSGLGGSTQFAGPSGVTGIFQDGFASGELVDILTADDGTITGLFSNGQSRAIAQVALANFQSEGGLRRAGNQLYRETPNSGEALVGAAASGVRGAIAGGSLEGSNVDLGNELVTLIAYQRAFQANARTISTADEMLAEVANLKR